MGLILSSSDSKNTPIDTLTGLPGSSFSSGRDDKGPDGAAARPPPERWGGRAGLSCEQVGGECSTHPPRSRSYCPQCPPVSYGHCRTGKALISLCLPFPWQPPRFITNVLPANSRGRAAGEQLFASAAAPGAPCLGATSLPSLPPWSRCLLPSVCVRSLSASLL